MPLRAPLPAILNNHFASSTRSSALCVCPLTAIFRMSPFFRNWIDRMAKTIIRIVFKRHALTNANIGREIDDDRSTYAGWNPFGVFFAETFSRVRFQTQFLVLTKFDDEDICRETRKRSKRDGEESLRSR